MKVRICIGFFLFITLVCEGQDQYKLELIRSDFQNIRRLEDIEDLLSVTSDTDSDDDQHTIKAYQAAATCMMAKYEKSPIEKMKYFYKGRKWLEKIIEKKTEVENRYLRLLIQLNVPRMLNYYSNIEEDIAYLEKQLAKSQIPLSYKYQIIENLLTATDSKEIEDSISQINLDNKS